MKRLMQLDGTATVRIAHDGGDRADAGEVVSVDHEVIEAWPGVQEKIVMLDWILP